MSQQQQQTVSQSAPPKPQSANEYPGPRSHVNLNKYNFNYGGGTIPSNDDLCEMPKPPVASQKQSEFHFQQHPVAPKPYAAPQAPSWFNEGSFQQPMYQKQPLYGFEPPSTTRSQAMPQLLQPMAANNVLINSMYSQQLGKSVPSSSGALPNDLLMNLALLQNQMQGYTPQQQQQLLQQYSNAQMLNMLQMNPGLLNQSQQQQQQQPKNYLASQQQQQQQQQPWTDQSQIQTPLESSRYMMEQQPMPNLPPMQQNQNPNLGQLSQMLGAQNMQFANNYHQHLENLNQYKKLVSFLESIDQKKANNSVLAPQLPQFQPESKNPQQSFISHYPPPQQQQQQPAPYFKPQEESRFDYANDTLGTASVAWPSSSGGDQNKGTWGTFDNDPCESNNNNNKSAYNTFNEQSSKKGGGAFYEQAHSMQESQIESKLEEIGAEIVDFNRQQQQQQFQKKSFGGQEETSKLSGGEVTKETITDLVREGQPGGNGSEEHKSMDEFQNQSQMSSDSKQNRLHTSKSPDTNHLDINEGELQANSQRSQQENSQNYMSTNEGEWQEKEVIDEKPIVSKQMTFEELLERKLQEEGGQREAEGQQQKPKREFLRKSSNIRGGAGSAGSGGGQQQERPKSKYKYYADNFTPQQQQQQQQQQQPPSSNRIQSQQMQHSPKVATSQKKVVANENAIQNSLGKRSYQNQKSNQKQPKQQSNSKQAQSRPQSSQNQGVSERAAKQANQSQPRSRQSLVQVANVQTTGNQNQSKLLNPAELEDDQIISERSSVLEFEMLEKECIQRHENKSKFSKEESKKPSSSIDPQQQQQHLDQKIKELDYEIEKFRKENKKVSQMQRECESQLSRINKEIEEFEERKEQDVQEMEAWKREQVAEIEEERRQMEGERKALELERKQAVKEKEQQQKSTQSQKSKQQEEQQLNLIKQQQEELQRLRRYVGSLEAENKDLKGKIDELTDKELHCKGTQTEGQNRANDILRQVEHIIEEEEGEDGSKQSSAKEEADFGRVESEANQEEDQDAPNDQEEEECKEDPLLSSRHPESPSTNLHNNNEEEEEEEEDEEEEDEYELKFLAEYHGPEQKKVKLLEEVKGHDGKVQRIFENGKKEVVFSNGVKREVWPDGYSLVQFNNNDVKQTFPDGKIVYYFSEAKTTQTTFPNGLQVFKFSNSQIEKHFVDGTKEISFPDGTIKCLFPDGEEESIFPDGTIQKIEKSGTKIVEFPNGQKDILYPDGTKVREYEDGTVKKIFPDGKTQTVAPSSAKKQTPMAQKKQTTTPAQNKYAGLTQSVRRK